MSKSDILALQHLLLSLGFDPGAVDGIYGPKTRSAYEQYLATRPRDPATIAVPAAAKPWWESQSMLSSIATVATGAGTLLAVVGTGGVASLGTPAAIGGLTAVITGLSGMYGTARRSAPIDPTLVAPGHRLGTTTR